jgi:glycosyltransferase involved in cell wall biosynthesis
MKILLVANTDWYLYNFRRTLAGYLETLGHSVTLVSPTGPFVPDIRRLGLRWLEWPVGRQSTGPGELLAILRLARLYQREQPALVHHFTVKPVIYGSLAAQLSRVPAVVNAITGLGYVFVRNSTRARVLRPAVLGLYRMAFRHPRRATIFENNFDRDFFVEHGLARQDEGRVIAGAGVDLEHFIPAPEPPGVPLVVLPARMLWDKGVGDLVEASRRLNKRGALRIALVGPTDPGNPANIPVETLQGWVREGLVEWWGFQDDMRTIYWQATIVVLPSMGEGVPTALLEAAACGRALVTTDVPGCRDVVADGETGLLVPPGDPAALADALERLASDPALRVRLATAARERVMGRFSLAQVNSETAAVYEAVSR